MTVVPMKDDADFREHNSKAMEVASRDLREFVSDVEALDSQIRDIQRDRKDLFTVAKSKGYDVKALRRLLAERRRDAADLAEEKALAEQYRELLL
jgi:uncharacterized protein (UPF0335 family)